MARDEVDPLISIEISPIEVIKMESEERGQVMSPWPMALPLIIGALVALTILLNWAGVLPP